MCKAATLIGFDPDAPLPPFQRGVRGDGERGSSTNVLINNLPTVGTLYATSLHSLRLINVT